MTIDQDSGVLRAGVPREETPYIGDGRIESGTAQHLVHRGRGSGQDRQAEAALDDRDRPAATASAGRATPSARGRRGRPRQRRRSRHGRWGGIILAVALTRRTVLGAGLATGMAALTGCDGIEHASWSPPGETTAEAVPTTAPIPPAYERRLVDTLTRFLAPTPENPDRPTYAGAVVLVAVDGQETVRVAVGDAVRYGAGPVELPEPQRVAMRTDSVFDLASLTKVYTTVLVLQQVDRGRVDLGAPVVEYLPGFTGPGKAAVTVSMLLTHTAGLPVGAAVSGLRNNAERRAAVLATRLITGETPGRTFRYSSVGLMVLAQLVEQVSGQSLEDALRTGITAPLGLRDTGFRPLTWLSQADRSARVVATDARSSRGLLRGVVHDDVANALGGVAGHAGIFGTAADVAVLGQALLDAGGYRGERILAASTVRRMMTNANPGLPAIDPDRPGRSADHGLGVELNQPWFMGRLASLDTFGHTGFTGTSLLVDRRRRLVLVLLTNRAHPNWSWANPDPMRAAIADVLADEVPHG
jgi:CubicO group peptidase (beta-lactamase class C family)